jgi:hypothetical protein
MTATPSNPVQSCQPITEDSPMTDRPSPDIVERLRSHAPSMGYGGCQDCYDLVMEDAADEIERLRAQIQPATPTAGEPVMWCGWHPEHGYAAQTCGHNEQHASSLLMRTDIAGNHGWSVVPLYPATGGDAVAGDGEAATPTAWRVWWVGMNRSQTELFEDRAEATAKARETGGCIIPLFTGVAQAEREPGK